MTLAIGRTIGMMGKYDLLVGGLYMELFLIRHAIAVARDPTVPEAQRPLGSALHVMLG